jgi:hypothetical protein
MNPQAYEDHAPMPILTMPNIHPLLDHDYKPYDVGVMGDLDAKMLLQLTTSTKQATQIASQWDGGIYYVAQQKHAADPKSTASVALLYLSRWKNPATAQTFAKNYELEIANQYPGAKLQPVSTLGDRVYSTSQGPVLITITNRYVFVSESFPLPIARKLNLMLLNAQSAFTGQETAAYHPAYSDLTGGLRNFMQQAGFLRVELPIAARFAHIEARH